MGWKFVGVGRGYDGDDYQDEMIDKKLKKIYHKGMEEGYDRAMEELEGGRFGERNEMYRMPRSYERGNMFDDMDDDMFGERRGVKGTGPYSRVRRR